MMSNTHTIQSDMDGNFNSQFPIFLSATGMPPSQYQETLKEFSQKIQQYKATKSIIGLVYMLAWVGWFLFTILMLFTVFGLIFSFAIAIFLAIFMSIHYKMMKESLKQELSEFVEEENKNKYQKYGVQLLFFIKPIVTRDYFDREDGRRHVDTTDIYEIQMIVMSRQQQNIVIVHQPMQPMPNYPMQPMQPMQPIQGGMPPFPNYGQQPAGMPQIPNYGQIPGASAPQMPNYGQFPTQQQLYKNPY